MKIINQNVFTDVMKKQKSADLAHTIHREHNFLTFTIEEIDDAYLAYGDFNYHNKTITASIQVDSETQEVFDYDCHCPYCTADSGCAHVGALILKMEECTPSVLPYHYEVNDYATATHSEENAIQRTLPPSDSLPYLNIRSKALIELLKENILPIEIEPLEKITLVPNIQIVQHHYNNPEIHIEFKIGYQKLYQIKDISVLLNQIKAEETVHFGKSFNAKLRYENFDNDSQRIIDYLRLHTPVVEYPYYNQFRTHVVKTDNLTDFYTCFSNLEKNHSFTFIEDQTKLNLFFEPMDESGFIFYFELESLYISEKYLYEIQQHPNTLKRYSFNHIDELYNFYDLVTRNNLDYVSFEDLHTFYQYTLVNLLDDIELVDFPTTLPGGDRSTTLELYGDINAHSQLEFSLHLIHADGSKTYGFSDQPTTDKNMIRVERLIESYAQSIEKSEQKAFFDLNTEQTYHFLKYGLDKLNEYCTIFITDAVKSLGTTKHYSLSMSVHIASNLLEVDISSSDIPLSELADVLKNYKLKKKFHRLKNGELLYLESDDLNELNQLFEDTHLDINAFDEGKLQLPLYRSFQTEDTFQDFKHITVTRSESFKNCVESFQQKTNNFEVNPKYLSILRDYQISGVQWLGLLNSYGFNGILADDMGLGKTLQVISLLDSLDSEKPNLVICPASLILNWEDEVQKFSGLTHCLSIHGTSEYRKQCIENITSHHLYITSYDYIRRDFELYKDIDFNYVILDEAQYIKNHNTKNASAVKSLKSAHRLALTGTPIENSLAELWSIFDFLMPNYLYNYNYFRKNFEVPIVKSNDVTVQAQLKRLVEPFILRRVKSSVLSELPDKMEQTISIDLNDEEEKLYLAHALQVSTNIEQQLKSDSIDHIKIIAMITKLRQLCIEPRLVFNNIVTPSSKMEACLDIVSTFQQSNKKILLFSSFTSVFTLLTPELKKAGIKFHLLTGSTDKSVRRQLVKDFQTDDSTVFLISLKAGGTGLNLTAAEGVIHFDPWWNVSAQNQATDRSHRIGQKNVVQVYKLIAKNTIEEKIVQLQETKKNLADTFVEGNEGVLTSLSPEQLLELLK